MQAPGKSRQRDTKKLVTLSTNHATHFLLSRSVSCAEPASLTLCSAPAFHKVFKLSPASFVAAPGIHLKSLALLTYKHMASVLLSPTMIVSGC